MRLISKNSIALFLGLFLVLALTACSSDVTTPTSGLTSEGTVGAPILLVQGDLPRSSRVADSGHSYYVVSGLAAAGQFTVSISGGTTDIDLDVDQGNFAGGQECSSSSSAGSESCVAFTGVGGTLFIDVYAFGGALGTTFTLNVQ